MALEPSYARSVFVVDGLWNAFRMAWEVWWALVLGFALSGIVQAWVPRSRLARAHALAAQSGHEHHSAESGPRLLSLEAWSDVAHNFRADWEMLWKEILGGFLIAGYVSLLPRGFFNALFLTHQGGALRLLENV